VLVYYSIYITVSYRTQCNCSFGLVGVLQINSQDSGSQFQVENLIILIYYISIISSVIADAELGKCLVSSCV